MAINISDKQRAVFLPNDVFPVSGAKANQSTVVLSVTFVSQGASTLGTVIDGHSLVYAVPGIQLANASAVAIQAQWQVDLDAAFGPGVFSTSILVDAVTITKNDATPMAVGFTSSTDLLQTITPTAGWYVDNAMFFRQTVMGTGLPVKFSDGFAVSPSIPTAGRQVVVTLNAELFNMTGASKSARWRVYWWFDYMGWVVDQEVGIRLLTEATGATIGKDAITVSAVGAKRVAVELIDNNAGADLAPGSSLSVWGLVSN